MTHFWNFGTPSNIAGTNESGNFKFGTDMEGSEYEDKKFKIRSKGVMWGSRDPLLEFLDPLISGGRLKLETSNLAQKRRSVSCYEKN